MLAKICSGAVVGLDASPVTVEVDIASKGLPSFIIVGLPDKAVEESKERVRSAIKNSGATFPVKRITVNLAPADLPKNGPAYDLPIALGILKASGQVVIPDDALFVGELSLDGALRHANGILPLAELAKLNKSKTIYVPSVDAKEAAFLSQVHVYAVPTLHTLVQHLNEVHVFPEEKYIPFASLSRHTRYEFDMADIHGQEQAKRVLEIAAAGAHNVFLKGPPGAGKTMLARTLPSILPSLSEKEAIEVTKIYSVTGNLAPGESLLKIRPFRAPHHTMSRIGLIGGGTHPMPGEISLAHRGVLFLDELPEFPRHVTEALRQPIEDGMVSISRAAGSVTYPSKCLVIAAANPCPCGNFGSLQKPCTCPPGVASRYQKRISGPLLDRIDLHLFVQSVPVEHLTTETRGQEPSKQIQERVEKARAMQLKRYGDTPFVTNSDLNTKSVRTYASVTPEAETFLKLAVSRLMLSARGFYRVIKVARTIADLAGDTSVLTPHVAEALQYRAKD